MTTANDRQPEPMTSYSYLRVSYWTQGRFGHFWWPPKWVDSTYSSWFNISVLYSNHSSKMQFLR